MSWREILLIHCVNIQHFNFLVMQSTILTLLFVRVRTIKSTASIQEGLYAAN